MQPAYELKKQYGIIGQNFVKTTLLKGKVFKLYPTPHSKMLGGRGLEIEKIQNINLYGN